MGATLNPKFQIALGSTPLMTICSTLSLSEYEAARLSCDFTKSAPLTEEWEAYLLREGVTKIKTNAQGKPVKEGSRYVIVGERAARFGRFREIVADIGDTDLRASATARPLPSRTSCLICISISTPFAGLFRCRALRCRRPARTPWQNTPWQEYKLQPH